jgi:glycosyltransferase involved in cell wall biosynthesis
MSDEINEYIKRQGVEDRVNMAGVVSNVNEYMQAMDCLLFPSLWEGLPVTVIESQTAGLPSVLADTISKEVEITKLVSWHNLSESDDVWVDTAMQLSQQARGHRKSPIIDVRAHGYDIKTTAKWLETFYMEKYEQSEGIRSKNTNK